jgi:hypothetical protein
LLCLAGPKLVYQYFHVTHKLTEIKVAHNIHADKKIRAGAGRNDYMITGVLCSK